MNEPYHWAVFDRETGGPKYGYEPPVQEPGADAPVPFTLTPEGEAAAAESFVTFTTNPSASYLASLAAERAGREARGPSDAEAWGGRADGELKAGTWDYPNEPWWRAPANDPAHPDHKDAVAAAREADIEAADEWDDADSNAYQDRVEAGLEPEAGAVTAVYGPRLPDADDVQAAYANAVAAEDPSVPDAVYEAALDAWGQTEAGYLAAHPGGEADQAIPTRTAQRELEAG